jgi:hypothetical protein
LEFDEEDEDFWELGLALCWMRQYRFQSNVKLIVNRGGTSRDDGVSVDSLLSPSTASVNTDDDVVGTVDEEIWHGWDYGDEMAIGSVSSTKRSGNVLMISLCWVFLDAEQEASKLIAIADGEGRKRKGRERRKHLSSNILIV